MNYRELERKTLSFDKQERKAVLETFYPWILTIKKWANEGLEEFENFNAQDMKEVFALEQKLGFDPLKRFLLLFPFKRECIKSECDWKEFKQTVINSAREHFSEERIREMFEPLCKGHKNGEFSIRAAIGGYFWFPRVLMGVEEHLYAFYDFPEMMHDMNETLLMLQFEIFEKVFTYLSPDVVYIQEDLSGKNGPMLSREHFVEFVGNYYKKIVPFLKRNGVGHVFVDTDGDFTALIPDFLNCGIDGFLPIDVNSGVDFTKIRSDYPTVKFIGGFNKLAIADGKEAIDLEFERIRSVYEQGGYIIGCDHQVAPATSLENYTYYINKLKEISNRG